MAAGLGPDWPAIERAAAWLGSSPQSTMMCEHMGAGLPEFAERGIAFHATADGIGAAARAQDQAAVIRSLEDTLAVCTSCHAAYRQDVVSEAEYAAVTGAEPPHQE